MQHFMPQTVWTSAQTVWLYLYGIHNIPRSWNNLLIFFVFQFLKSTLILFPFRSRRFAFSPLLSSKPGSIFPPISRQPTLVNYYKATGRPEKKILSTNDMIMWSWAPTNGLRHNRHLHQGIKDGSHAGSGRLLVCFGL